MISEDQFGEVRCPVASVPLPRSTGRGPSEAIVFQLSANCLRRNLREKDLKAIVLNVIDQADFAPKFLFGRRVALCLLEIREAFLKASDVRRIVFQGVIRKADSAGEIRAEEFCYRFLRKTELGKAFAIGLTDE